MVSRRKTIDLDEALDLMDDAIGRELLSSSRWTNAMRYIVAYEQSPSGHAWFMLTVPKSNENTGIVDTNAAHVDLVACRPVEVKVTKWVAMDGETT